MHELEREQVNFGVASNERNHTIGFPVDHLEARLLQSDRVWWIRVLHARTY
jgi:hypothetical protein